MASSDKSKSIGGKSVNEEKANKPEALPEKSDFINWYNACLKFGEIADKRYPVKGTFVWMPYGLKAMKNLIKIWDSIFQENGIEEAYFPIFVPFEFAQKNKEWFEGFKEDLFVARPYSHTEESYILRPTGEPAIYPMFQLWVKDGRLPIKVYQTVSSLRYEGKTTHSLIRDREITYWYEIHTAHKTREEANEEMEKHIKINEHIWNEVLNIPPIEVDKPKWEIFPGAESAVEFYTILPDGRLLENGSVNNLGQAYAKRFEIYYTNENGEREYCWQVCTGNGARYLVAAIALHGDERGIVFPPKIAPIQVVIIPISTNDEKINEEIEKLAKALQQSNVKVFVDKSEKKSIGEKFNLWDIKGVPIRIEIGSKELQKGVYTVYARDEKVRKEVPKDKCLEYVLELLNKEIPNRLYNKVKEFYGAKIKYFEDVKKGMEWIKNGGVAEFNWCGDKKCYDEITSLEEGVEIVGVLRGKTRKGKCKCGKPSEKLILVGRTY